MTLLLAAALSVPCVAIDGDTLRCRIKGQQVSVRLLAIDTPELPGHCRKGRKCAPGDPWLAKRTLERAIRFKVVQVQPRGWDRFGRMLATARVDPNGDLSCHQLRERVAIYVRHWDTGRAVARQCPEKAR